MTPTGVDVAGESVFRLDSSDVTEHGDIQDKAGCSVRGVTKGVGMRGAADK